MLGDVTSLRCGGVAADRVDPPNGAVVSKENPASAGLTGLHDANARGGVSQS